MDEWSPAYNGDEDEVADTIRLNRLDEKWEVDGQHLVTKARGWTFGQRYAVADAVERWRSPQAEKSEPDDRQRLRLVGLARYPADSMRWRP